MLHIMPVFTNYKILRCHSRNITQDRLYSPDYFKKLLRGHTLNHWFNDWLYVVE